MLESQTNLIPKLFTSDQGMMMVQPQASLYHNSTQRILFEGLPCYSLETMGRDVQWAWSVTFLLPPGDNVERLRAKVTRKLVEHIEKADGERIQNLRYILGIGNG